MLEKMNSVGTVSRKAHVHPPPQHQNREHLLAVSQPTTKYKTPLPPILCPTLRWGKPRGPMRTRLLPPGSPPPLSHRPNDRDQSRRRKLYRFHLSLRTDNCLANSSRLRPRIPNPRIPPKLTGIGTPKLHCSCSGVTHSPDQDHRG